MQLRDRVWDPPPQVTAQVEKLDHRLQPPWTITAHTSVKPSVSFTNFNCLLSPVDGKYKRVSASRIISGQQPGNIQSQHLQLKYGPGKWRWVSYLLIWYSKPMSHDYLHEQLTHTTSPSIKHFRAGPVTSGNCLTAAFSLRTLVTSHRHLVLWCCLSPTVQWSDVSLDAESCRWVHFISLSSDIHVCLQLWLCLGEISNHRPPSRFIYLNFWS